MEDIIDDEIIDSFLDLIKEGQVIKAREDLPFAERITKEMIDSRGNALQGAITVEWIYRYILIGLIKMNEREVIEMSFSKKSDKIIELLNKYLKDIKVREELIKDVTWVRKLRNLYAHIPLDPFSKETRFEQNEAYYKADEKEFIGKTLKEINKDYSILVKSMPEKMFILIKEIIKKDGFEGVKLQSLKLL